MDNNKQDSSIIEPQASSLQQQVVLGQTDKGRKYDDKKRQWSMLSSLIPELEQVVKVLEHGATKYGKDNWKDVKPFKERYTNALMRHVVAYISDETFDKDTMLHHLAHAVCNCLFLIWGDDNEEDER